MWGVRNIENMLAKILYKTKFLEDFSGNESIISELNFKTYGGSYEVDFSGWTTIQW